MKRLIAFALFLLPALICNKAFAAEWWVSSSSGTDNVTCGSAGSPCATGNYLWNTRGMAGGDTAHFYNGGSTHTAISNPPNGSAGAYTQIIGDDDGKQLVAITGGGSAASIDISGSTQKQYIKFKNFKGFNNGENSTFIAVSDDGTAVVDEHNNLIFEHIFSSGTARGSGSSNCGNIEMAKVRNSTVTYFAAVGQCRNMLMSYGTTSVEWSTGVIRRDYNGSDGNPSHGLSVYNSIYTLSTNLLFIDGRGPVPSNVSDHGAVYSPGNLPNPGASPYSSADDNIYKRIVVVNHKADSGEIGIACEGGGTGGGNNKRNIFEDLAVHGSAYGMSFPNRNDDYRVRRVSITSMSVIGIYAGNANGGTGGSLQSIFVSSCGTGLSAAPSPTGSNIVGNGTNYSGSSAGTGTISTAALQKYIIRVETGSVNKGAGVQGEDIGANIDRFYDPTATVPTKFMWPWPDEDRIRTFICSVRMSTFCLTNDSTGKAMTLSTYILTQLNYPYPAEYSATTSQGCSGTSLNPSLTNITTGSFTASWTAGPGNYVLVVDDNSDFSSPVSSGTVTSNSWGVGDLSPNTLYYVEVKNIADPDCAYSSTSGTTLQVSSGSGAAKIKMGGSIGIKGSLIYR